MSTKRKIFEIETDLNEQKIMKENNKIIKKFNSIDYDNDNDNNNNNSNNSNNNNEDDEENQVTNDEYYDVSKVNIEEIISTEDIAQNLKNFLAKERIKHEIFSKSILNCSKSTLARLLYEPKTWSTINDMWKLYFKIIYLWLNDKKRLDKLKYNKKLPVTIKTELDNDIKSPSLSYSNINDPNQSLNDNEFDIIETFRANKKS